MIAAAGPLTLEEAEESLSSRPPPSSRPQAGPSPEYASELPPAVEICSCDEALALRAEVARLTEALAAAEVDSKDYEQRWMKAERECGAAQAETAQLLEAQRG